MRHTARAGAFVCLLLVLTACGGGSGGGGVVVPPPPPVPVLLELLCGFELLESTGSYTPNLPAGFFGPGSDPFTDTINLEGAPLETRGPFELGTADTIVERLDDIALADAPSSDAIPIEIVELSLVSAQPITVTSNGGQDPQLWDVRVTLNPVLRSAGPMTLDRATEEGGTFTSSMPVRPIFTFKQQALPQQRVSGASVSATISGTWSTDIPVAEEAYRAAVSKLNPGFLREVTLSSATFNLLCVPAGTDPLAPGPTMVDPTASVAADVGSLGRGCVIGPGATVGSGAIIGPNVLVGPGCTIGANACIGDLTEMGNDCSVGAGSTLGSESVLGASVSIGADTVVGSNAQISDSVVIGDGCHCGDDFLVEQGSTLGNGVIAGNNVSLGQNVSVTADLNIASDAIVAMGVSVTEDIVRCIDETGVATVVPASQCGDLSTPSYIEGFVPGFYNPTNGIEPPAQAVTPVNPAALPPDLQNLAGDVGSDIARPALGGTGQAYTEPAYDCDDYAEDLRAKLANLGYMTSFTVVYTVNPNRSWWQFWKPKLINGHCFTDVHRANGDTIWIEAQRPGSAGAIGIDLDDSGNGSVTFASGPGVDATDGTLRIEVYDSAADATASGRALD